MAECTIGVTDERAAYDQAEGARSSPVLFRCTAPDALSNFVAVLELAADRQLRYGAATRRPLATTVRLVEDARNFLERLDDRRLELMNRRVIDVIPRLAEEPDRRQLGRHEPEGRDQRRRTHRLHRTQRRTAR